MQAPEVIRHEDPLVALTMVTMVAPCRLPKSSRGAASSRPAAPRRRTGSTSQIGSPRLHWLDDDVDEVEFLGKQDKSLNPRVAMIRRGTTPRHGQSSRASGLPCSQDVGWVDGWSSGADDNSRLKFPSPMASMFSGVGCPLHRTSAASERESIAPGSRTLRGPAPSQSRFFGQSCK